MNRAWRGSQMREAVISRLDAVVDRLPGGRRMILRLQIRWLLPITLIIANVGGAVAVLLFAGLVVPSPPEVEGDTFVVTINVLAFFAYTIVAFPIAVIWGDRLVGPASMIVQDDTEADEAQGQAIIKAPLRITLVVGLLWMVGAVGWAGLNLTFSGLLAFKVGMSCVIGALTTCAVTYLLAEYFLRPAAARVLSHGPRRLPRQPGVTTRTMLAWALGTALPVVALLSVAVAGLLIPEIDRGELIVSTIGLGTVALFSGVAVTFIATRAVSDPIRSVRTAMARVERGDLDTEVEVYDASEVGRLQVGFNHMVAGLRDHQRLREIFGRQVGEDVAELAINGDVALGGETREVAVLFVDITGATRLPLSRPPGEVVALLNLFFGVVVDTVNAYGGWINKFEGDAALAVFGAPAELTDSAGAALAAGRELAVRLRAEVPELDAGIGVSAGEVVAGYIGAEQRFEYTVIGDPVNEAARLCDLAKSERGRILASGTAVDGAAPAEADRWKMGNTITVKGRDRPTRLAVPDVQPEQRRWRTLRSGLLRRSRRPSDGSGPPG